MENQLYENSYKNKNNFSFGKNWQGFLKGLNNEKIEEAPKSIKEFLDCESLRGKTIVDIGSGSGLFSLAFKRLGASKILSVDIDDFSLSCTNYLWEKEGRPNNWEIKKGSALDKEFLESLGKFDIVYSWGVLHHTGKIFEALENIKTLASSDTLLYLALYNKFETKFRGGTSEFWLKVKRIYNSSGYFIKNILEFLFMTYGIIGILARFKNPFKEIVNYKNYRGMSWRHDRIDWLGGYPYEFASVDEIINFYGEDNFYTKKIKSVNGIGCNEFLIVKKD